MKLGIYETEKGEYKIEIIGSRGLHTYAYVLETPVLLNDKICSLQEAIQEMHNESVSHYDKDIAVLENRIAELEKQVLKQKEINKGLLEAIKDGGII